MCHAVSSVQEAMGVGAVFALENDRCSTLLVSPRGTCLVRVARGRLIALGVRE